MLFASNANAASCFIAAENDHMIAKEGACDERYTPASTFKIVIALMGFDAHILLDQTQPVWDFKPGYVDWIQRWQQPHNPKLWFVNSCVWYSQVITKKLGMDRFNTYVRRFHYGNQDTSGDKGMHSGLSHCWLSSSLKISPQEQIDLLNQLVANRLPVSVDAQEKTKSIMYQSRLPNGWDLYGKTGNGSYAVLSGQKRQDRQAGWFVGFVRKGNKTITFVQLIIDEDQQDTYASLRAKAALKDRLEQLIIQR